MNKQAQERMLDAIGWALSECPDCYTSAFAELMNIVRSSSTDVRLPRLEDKQLAGDLRK